MATEVQNIGAPSWFPNTLDIADDDVIVQIAGKRPGRMTIAIANIGTDDARLYAVPDSTAGSILLLAGGSLSIDTTAEVYATSTNGTTIQTMETVVPPSGTGNTGEMPSYVAAIK